MASYADSIKKLTGSQFTQIKEGNHLADHLQALNQNTQMLLPYVQRSSQLLNKKAALSAEEKEELVSLQQKLNFAME